MKEKFKCKNTEKIADEWKSLKFTIKIKSQSGD